MPLGYSAHHVIGLRLGSRFVGARCKVAPRLLKGYKVDGESQVKRLECLNVKPHRPHVRVQPVGAAPWGLACPIAPIFVQQPQVAQAATGKTPLLSAVTRATRSVLVSVRGMVVFLVVVVVERMSSLTT